MPVMERDNDHEGQSDGGDEGKDDEAVEEGQVGAGCRYLGRRILIDIWMDRITHT